MGTSIKADWALREWIEAQKIWDDLVSQQKPVSNEVTRAVADRALVFLVAYYQPENWESGAPIVPIPTNLAYLIARNLFQISSGHIPLWMLAVQKTGAPKNNMAVQRWIGLGLAYRDASQKGFISDKSSTKTVAEAFNVSRRSVELWAESHASDFRNWFPEAIDDKERAQQIEGEFPKAASEYVRWGRGTNNPRAHGKATRRPPAKR